MPKRKRRLIVAPFDASEYLDDKEVIAEYLGAALEDRNPNVFLHAVVGCDQMFTAHRCETAPVVDSPRHPRKTHGPEPDAARLPSVQ
jgi:hypothetical protein